MKNVAMRLNLGAVGLLLLASTAGAAPLDCSAPPPPAQVVAIVGSPTNGFSYTCGGLTFSNFLADDAGNAFGLNVNLVNATFDSTTGLVILGLNPSLISGLGQDIHLFFTVQGPLLGIDVSIGGGTLARVDETACSTIVDPASGNCTGGLGNELAFISNTSGNDFVTGLFPGVSNTTYIFKDIGVQLDGSSSSIRESFLVGVPEPMTLSLMGVGLLGLGLLGRRLRK